MQSNVDRKCNQRKLLSYSLQHQKDMEDIKEKYNLKITH